MLQSSRLTPISPDELPAEIDGIPYFHQRDERWCNEPYTIIGNPDQTIGSSGCVPTTEAMLHASLAADSVVTPLELAKWNLENGFRTVNDGTDSLKSLPAFAKRSGFVLENEALSPAMVGRVLGRKGLVYTVLDGSSRPGSLATSEAHVVLIRGVAPDGSMKVHTSESVEKSLRPWSAKEVVSLADPLRTFGVFRK